MTENEDSNRKTFCICKINVSIEPSKMNLKICFTCKILIKISPAHVFCTLISYVVLCFVSIYTFNPQKLKGGIYSKCNVFFFQLCYLSIKYFSITYYEKIKIHHNLCPVQFTYFMHFQRNLRYPSPCPRKSRETIPLFQPVCWMWNRLMVILYIPDSRTEILTLPKDFPT